MRAKHIFGWGVVIAAATCAIALFVMTPMLTARSTASTFIAKRVDPMGGNAIYKAPLAAIEKYLPRRSPDAHVAIVPLIPNATLWRPHAVVAEVDRAAREGSAAAMYWMGMALRKCTNIDTRTDAEIEDSIAKRSVGWQEMSRDRGENTSETKTVEDASALARSMETLRDECANFSTSEIADWQDWLRQAAAAGDSAARDEYAHAVMDKYKDPNYKAEHYADFSRENAQAIEYLEDAIAAGDCSNDILNGFRWVQQHDMTRLYVYQSLLLKSSMTGAASELRRPDSRQDLGNTLLATELQRLAYSVPKNAFEDADAASDYILHNLCQPAL